MGKHIAELKQLEGSAKESVPEVFLLLIGYYEANPELMKTEIIFRKNSSQIKLDDLERHLALGNYYYINSILDDPHVAANLLKKVLK